MRKPAKNNFLDRIFLPPEENTEFTMDSYLYQLNSGAFRDKMVLGISETRTLQMADFTISPNSLYIGSMGSGKSIAANFSIVTWMLANSDHTLLFIIDTLKGANDYIHLHGSGYSQIFSVLSSETGVIRTIDLMYDELMARREKFNEVQADNISKYEEKIQKKNKDKNYRMAKCILLMEEFHAIPFAIMDFDKQFKQELTTAFKFHQIMRTGRSYGIWVVACSQKGTSSDIPPAIIPNFVNKQIFKVSKAESSYFLGHAKASEIRPDQKGRCETEYGTMQFPMIVQDSQKTMLNKYMKPLNADFAYVNLEMIKDYLSGKTFKELYKFKKLSELCQGIESYDPALVISILHERQGHSVEEKDPHLDQFGISHIINWGADIRVAVVTRASSNEKKVAPKHIQRLKKGMDKYECTHGIIYTSSRDLPTAAYKAANEENIELVDHEDLIRLARRIETEADLKLDPTKLADDAKESGEYGRSSFDSYSDEDESFSGPKSSILDGDLDDEKHSELEDLLNLSETEIIEKGIDVENLLKKAQEKELEAESFENEESFDEKEDSFDEFEEIVDVVKSDEMQAQEEQESFEKDAAEKKEKLESDMKDMLLANKSINQNKAIKRPVVKRVFTLKSNDIPMMIVHCLKNDAGEIYRALFYTLVADKEVVHKYFIDRKVTKGNFSHKIKTMLGVNSTEEWNSQKEVLDDKEFQKEVGHLLSNFSGSSVSVNTVCWKDDEAFVKNAVKDLDYMSSYPTIMEDWLSSSFGINNPRDQLIEQFGVKVKRVDIWTVIDQDFGIWKQIG